MPVGIRPSLSTLVEDRDRSEVATCPASPATAPASGSRFRSSDSSPGRARAQIDPSVLDPSVLVDPDSLPETVDLIRRALR